MLTTSVDLPSRPEQVRIRSPETLAVGATGFQTPPHTKKKHFKRRKRPQLMHEVVQKQSSSLADPFFTYFQKLAQKGDSASCGFLLWGSKDSERSTTWAADVPIPDRESEDEIFRKLAARFSAERGFLRRYLYFRDFNRLKPVMFRFIRQCSGKFSVIMEPLDMSKFHDVYSKRKEEVEKVIDSITDFEWNAFPEHCFLDDSGEYQHYNGNCPANSPAASIDSVCPFEEWDVCNTQLCWIQTVPFLSCYFRDPTGARSQKILNGLNGHCYIHYYKNMKLPRYSSQSQIRDLQLDGLYVEMGWSICRCICIFISLVVLVSIGGKFIWGNWEIVFGAGSFFVAVPMLILAVLSYCEI